MSITNLTTIMMEGLNEPKCAFYTGQMFGEWDIIRILIIIQGLFLLKRFVERVGIDNLSLYVKNKIKGANEK